MARINTKPKFDEVTHEGAPAWPHATAEQRLRRSVLSCLLWEREFYEDGEDIAKRIAEAAALVASRVLADLAIEARTKFNLRHVPLLLLSVLVKTGRGSALVSDTIGEVIQRADELTEFLAIYAKANGVDPKMLKKKLAAQVKKGLAKAFPKFDAYQLAKYDRAGVVRLRDVLFLCHAKPKDEEQAALWAKLIANDLDSPDTWEVALSAGADKKDTFERLLREGKLGYLALLRNLRNMIQANVDPALITAAIEARKGAHRVLPFRYLAAARHAPMHEPAIDRAFQASLSGMEPLAGMTVVLVDVSGSMDTALSGKSDMRRMDAAAALGVILPGAKRVLTFSDALVEVPPRAGMAGIDVILKSQPHSGTRLGEAVAAVNANIQYDRLVVITDEQSASRVPDPIKAGYMINVASYKNGVGYGKWTHIDGFSENVLRFIAEHERPKQ
jgi:60 kDa SS-A/Ro ribonucleoprotein